MIKTRETFTLSFIQTFIQSLIKNKAKKKGKDLSDDKLFTFRTIVYANTFDVNVSDQLGIGILNITQSSTISPERNIQEHAYFNGIYSIYNFRNCYFCNSVNKNHVLSIKIATKNSQ